LNIKYLIKYTSLLLFLHGVVYLILPTHVYAQKNDSLHFSALNKTKLQIIMEDTYVVGGLTYSGIYYSKHFSELGYQPGFTLGIEQYLPLRRQVILITGININERNFSHNLPSSKVIVKNLFLNVPLIASLELPVLQEYDFRLLLGTNTSISRVHSNFIGSYETSNTQNQSLKYNKTDFNKMDFGYVFGITAEYKNWLVRAKIYSGLIKLDRKDQGMLHSFSLEVGYFLYRAIRK